MRNIDVATQGKKGLIAYILEEREKKNYCICTLLTCLYTENIPEISSQDYFCAKNRWLWATMRNRPVFTLHFSFVVMGVTYFSEKF